MKIFSANVFLPAIKVVTAFIVTLLSFRTKTRISHVAAGKTEQDRAEKESVLILFVSHQLHILIVWILGAQNLAQAFKKDLSNIHSLMTGH